jgi:hypothetical protein
VVEQGFIARVGDTVNPDEAGLNDHVQVASHTLLFQVIGKQIERVLHDAGAYRVSERADNREARSASRRPVL